MSLCSKRNSSLKSLFIKIKCSRVISLYTFWFGPDRKPGLETQQETGVKRQAVPDGSSSPHKVCRFNSLFFKTQFNIYNTAFPLDPQLRDPDPAKG